MEAFKKVPQVGLEPTPHELKARCSNQLSYWSIFFLRKHKPNPCIRFSSELLDSNQH